MLLSKTRVFRSSTLLWCIFGLLSSFVSTAFLDKRDREEKQHIQTPLVEERPSVGEQQYTPAQCEAEADFMAEDDDDG